MLSQSHPTYLSQLRTAVALTKSGTDKAIIFLTVVGVAVLCVQTLVGMISYLLHQHYLRLWFTGTLSLNVTVPQNDRSPDSPYHVFGIVIALASLILCGYMTVVRQWWIQAKRRRGAVL
jgi:magnesium transporter